MQLRSKNDNGKVLKVIESISAYEYNENKLNYRLVYNEVPVGCAYALWNRFLFSVRVDGLKIEKMDSMINNDV